MKKPSSKIVAIASLMLLIALTIPVINAQTITVTVDSEPVQWEDTFTVEGTGFSPSTPVAIGVGEEVTITDEVHDIPDPTGTGPFIAIVNHYPIKPGSFSFHCDVSGVTSDYYDDFANGTLNTSSTYAVDPFVNYVTGEFGRSTNSAWDTYIVVFTATYTYYSYNLTPDEGITTDGSGEFTAEIEAEGAYGNCSVTAVDETGKFATSSETIEIVPEGLTFAVMMLLSTAAVLVGSHYIRNRPKKQTK